MGDVTCCFFCETAGTAKHRNTCRLQAEKHAATQPNQLPIWLLLAQQFRPVLEFASSTVRNLSLGDAPRLLFLVWRHHAEGANPLLFQY
ncbi:hypothetical protein NC653_023339 [Populus alba x Populus x berolinensis]|uniref:Uncharacterized protein n=1 Tax=Populus alba x Populus x berolinensis TaxID=444605 RepID=A0AAD6QCS9_9ROSI|nr:hypothetical protein NC653_023339 [Populus alba x Populus x berolinensis]